jgi:hypothetical protein
MRGRLSVRGGDAPLIIGECVNSVNASIVEIWTLRLSVRQALLRSFPCAEFTP